MIVDYASLRSFDNGTLQAAADRWAAILTKFSTCANDYQTSVQMPVDNDAAWQGSAADAARRGVHATLDRISATGDYLAAVPTLLHGILSATPAMYGALQGVAAAQELASQGETLARANGAVVDDQGAVSLVDAAALSNNWDYSAVMAAMAAQSMIYRARWIATVVDQQIAPQLRYAHKFTPYQGGAWQHDAASDLTQADSATQAVKNAVDTYTTPDQPYHDTPAQPYNCMPATPDAYAEQVALETSVPEYFGIQGYQHAFVLFAHWLGNSGRPCLVNPDEMTGAMPTFNSTVEDYLRHQAPGPFDSGWQPYNPEAGGRRTESADWWWAMNDFRYRVSGLVNSLPTGQRTVEYTLGILKPYVFHPDYKNIPIPGTGGKIGVPQAVLVRQHMCGLSQNFVAQGISHHTR